MNRDEIQRRLAMADQHIGPITNLFTDKFVVVKGSLDKIGSMESTTTVSTDTTSRAVVGQVGSSSVFGGVGSSNSTTSVQVSKSISLLKIGTKSLTGVSIPNSGFFDAIDFGDEIGVILSENESQLFYIYDFSDGSSVGGRPSCSADLAKWVFMGIAAFLAWLTFGDILKSVTSFALPNLAFPLFTIAFFLLYRGCAIGSSLTKENWENALAHAQLRETI